MTYVKIPAADIAARILTIFCLFLLIPTVASAEPVAGTLAQWGLIGTAAKDCTKPASPSNAHTSYMIRSDGSVYYAPNYGHGIDLLNSYNVEEAVVEPSGSIVLRVTHTNKTPRTYQNIGPDGRYTVSLHKPREWTLTKDSGGRFRMMANREVGGDFSVLDGKVVNGAHTPWLALCK